MSAVSQEGAQWAEKWVPPDSDQVAGMSWRPMSACPEGHPLPMLPTKWFDGIAWRDGRETCRHCYEARTAMDRATRACLRELDH
jgi:hypothetical protein